MLAKKAGYRCSSLPGSIIRLLSKLNMPSTAMPSNLNGSVSIQKMGYKSKAKIARGQQNINKMNQAMNVNISKVKHC